MRSKIALILMCFSSTIIAADSASYTRAHKLRFITGDVHISSPKTQSTSRIHALLTLGTSLPIIALCVAVHNKINLTLLPIIAGCASFIGLAYLAIKTGQTKRIHAADDRVLSDQINKKLHQAKYLCEDDSDDVYDLIYEKYHQKTIPDDLPPPVSGVPFNRVVCYTCKKDPNLCIFFNEEQIPQVATAGYHDPLDTRIGRINTLLIKKIKTAGFAYDTSVSIEEQYQKEVTAAIVQDKHFATLEARAMQPLKNWPAHVLAHDGYWDTESDIKITINESFQPVAHQIPGKKKIIDIKKLNALFLAHASEFTGEVCFQEFWKPVYSLLADPRILASS